MHGFIINLTHEQRENSKRDINILLIPRMSKQQKTMTKKVKSMQGNKSSICLLRVPDEKDGENQRRNIRRENG